MSFHRCIWIAVLAAPAAAQSNHLALETGDWFIDQAAGSISWTLEFDRAPDFWSFDGYDRQADAFTIDVWTNATEENPTPGEEARRIYSNWRWDQGVEERFSLTSSRLSGTAVLETIGFDLAGSSLRFETSFDQLAWDGESGLHAVIDLYRYGAWSGQSTIVSTVVPAPATLLAAAAPFGLASLRRPRRAA